MATRTRKATIKSKAAAAPKRRRPMGPAARRRAGSGRHLVNFFVPLFFIFCILFCLGFLGFMGYRTVTASEFFEVKKIDVRGTTRTSVGEIEKLVSLNTEKSGVWNADLKEIKDRVEKLAFVKSAAVSRVLPDGVRVNVVERVPKAVVRFGAGDFWVDEEGAILAIAGKTEARPPFVLTGWDESKPKRPAKTIRNASEFTGKCSTSGRILISPNASKRSTSRIYELRRRWCRIRAKRSRSFWRRMISPKK
jgi:cell division septal protein FtsQ